MAGITNLAEYNAVIEQCGCCPAPRCCPPLIECQSGVATISKAGHLDPGSGSASELHPTRYLSRVHQSVELPSDTYGDYPYDPPSPGAEWLSVSIVSTAKERTIDRYTSAMDIVLNGAYFSGLACLVIPSVVEHLCEFSGTRTVTNYNISRIGGEWIHYIYSRFVTEYSSAEGLETEAHIAWEVEVAAWDAAHPDYAAEHAAWVAANALYQQWVADRDAWVNAEEGREPGDYPVPPPPDPGEEPPPRPVEPEEFYGPCVCKETLTQTQWMLDFVEGEGGGQWVNVPVPATEAEPNPIVTVSYWSDGFALEGPLQHDTLYEDPVSHEEFLSLARAWIATHADLVMREDDSSASSSGCEHGSLCYAKRRYASGNQEADFAIHEDFFRFRIKLNKCCGYKRIASRWFQVYYPQEWLDWQAIVMAGGSASSLPPEPDAQPEPTLQAWQWEGVPPLCPDSSSSVSVSSSASADVLDPYDERSMWSPWSLVIQVPGTGEGEVRNRLYQQKCHGNLWDDMPEIFGIYGAFSNSSGA